MPLLDNGNFLKALKKMLEDSRSGTGSVYVTFKSVVDEDVGKKKQKSVTLSQDYVCLVRASDGKSSRNKTKFSTAVKSKDLLSFQLSYSRIVSSAADSLKKPERKKKKKKATPKPQSKHV
jgi:hypothetical protein